MVIEEIIETVTRANGVQAAAMCDYEGIVIETQAAVGVVSHEHISAWTAEIGRAAATTCQSWGGDGLQTAVFEASMGTLMMADVGKGYLVVLSDPGGNPGLLRLEVESAAAELRRMLATGPVGESESETPPGRAATA